MAAQPAFVQDGTESMDCDDSHFPQATQKTYASVATQGGNRSHRSQTMQTPAAEVPGIHNNFSPRVSKNSNQLAITYPQDGGRTTGVHTLQGSRPLGHQLEQCKMSETFHQPSRSASFAEEGLHRQPLQPVHFGHAQNVSNQTLMQEAGRVDSVHSPSLGSLSKVQASQLGHVTQPPPLYSSSISLQMDVLGRPMEPAGGAALRDQTHPYTRKEHGGHRNHMPTSGVTTEIRQNSSHSVASHLIQGRESEEHGDAKAVAPALRPKYSADPAGIPLTQQEQIAELSRMARQFGLTLSRSDDVPESSTLLAAVNSREQTGNIQVGAIEKQFGDHHKTLEESAGGAPTFAWKQEHVQHGNISQHQQVHQQSQPARQWYADKYQQHKAWELWDTGKVASKLDIDAGEGQQHQHYSSPLVKPAPAAYEVEIPYEPEYQAWEETNGNTFRRVASEAPGPRMKSDTFPAYQLEESRRDNGENPEVYPHDLTNHEREGPTPYPQTMPVGTEVQKFHGQTVMDEQADRHPSAYGHPGDLPEDSRRSCPRDSTLPGLHGHNGGHVTNTEATAEPMVGSRYRYGSESQRGEQQLYNSQHPEVSSAELHPQERTPPQYSAPAGPHAEHRLVGAEVEKSHGQTVMNEQAVPHPSAYKLPGDFPEVSRRSSPRDSPLTGIHGHNGGHLTKPETTAKPMVGSQYWYASERQRGEQQLPDSQLPDVSRRASYQQEYAPRYSNPAGLHVQNNPERRLFDEHASVDRHNDHISDTAPPTHGLNKPQENMAGADPQRHPNTEAEKTRKHNPDDYGKSSGDERNPRPSSGPFNNRAGRSTPRSTERRYSTREGKEVKSGSSSRSSSSDDTSSVAKTSTAGGRRRRRRIEQPGQQTKEHNSAGARSKAVSDVSAQERERSLLEDLETCILALVKTRTGKLAELTFRKETKLGRCRVDELVEKYPSILDIVAKGKNEEEEFVELVPKLILCGRHKEREKGCKDVRCRKIHICTKFLLNREHVCEYMTQGSRRPASSSSPIDDCPKGHSLKNRHNLRALCKELEVDDTSLNSMRNSVLEDLVAFCCEEEERKEEGGGEYAKPSPADEKGGRAPQKHRRHPSQETRDRGTEPGRLSGNHLTDDESARSAGEWQDEHERNNDGARATKTGSSPSGHGHGQAAHQAAHGGARPSTYVERTAAHDASSGDTPNTSPYTLPKAQLAAVNARDGQHGSRSAVDFMTGQQEPPYGSEPATVNGCAPDSIVCGEHAKNKCRFRDRCWHFHAADGKLYQWQVREISTAGKWLNLSDRQCETLEAGFVRPEVDEVPLPAWDPGADRFTADHRFTAGDAGQLMGHGRQPWSANLVEMTAKEPEDSSNGVQERGFGRVLQLRRLGAYPRTKQDKGDAQWIWYFLDNKGRWVMYGDRAEAVYDTGRMTRSDITSDDVEIHFLRHVRWIGGPGAEAGPDTAALNHQPLTNVPPLHFQTSYHSYQLNFARMVQINQTVGTERDIRRRPAPEKPSGSFQQMFSRGLNLGRNLLPGSGALSPVGTYTSYYPFGSRY